MDRDFAIMAINACFRASRELGEIGVMVREFSSEAEGSHAKSQIGYALAEIGKINRYIYDLHPDLEKYVEANLDKFGRVS